jgi:hypothetical protein
MCFVHKMVYFIINKVKKRGFGVAANFLTLIFATDFAAKVRFSERKLSNLW